MEELSELLDMSTDSFDVLTVLSYILLALGLYTIAQRRGIRKPWLAWIPVANAWLIGCISDQYQFLAHGKQKSKRKTLLIFEILNVALTVVVVILLFALILCSTNILVEDAAFEAVLSDPDMLVEYLEITPESALQTMVISVAMVVCALSLIACAVVSVVIKFIAYADIFASCDLRNKTVFTAVGVVLSVLGLDIVLSVFVFLCRNKDEGMPPRKPVPQEIPAATEVSE